MGHRQQDIDTELVFPHAFQLFDHPESLAESVSNFVRGGVSKGDNILLAMGRNNWDATARHLRRGGLNPARLCSSGQLTVLDAAATLADITRHGTPDPDLFEHVIGRLVRDLLQADGQVRVYGELVDLLAERGDFRGALYLESLWNQLRERESFVLFCGYSAVSFGDPKFSDALQQTRCAHSHAHINPRDPLATFLLEASAAAAR